MYEEPGQKDEVQKAEEQHLLPVVAQPDEKRWWELQLGLRLLDGLYTERPAGP